MIPGLPALIAITARHLTKRTPIQVRLPTGHASRDRLR